MRGVWAAKVALVALAVLAGTGAAGAQAQPAPGRVLSRTLRSDLGRARATSGALVVDLSTGQTLYASKAAVPRLPASVEKLYTTSTALLRFGPSARLATSVLGIGSVDAGGGWNGTLYLRGGGDPTFGSASFDRSAYDSGATMQQLVANLIRQTRITSLTGSIVADESRFDSLRGTLPYGYRASTDIEGELSALVYNRGWANPYGTALQPRPALYAAQQFAAALRSAGVKVPRSTRIYSHPAPAAAQPLAAVRSPRVAWLIRLTNTPSDNFFAETLLKDIGASFVGAGTTAAGAAVVRAELASAFGIHAQLEDGSGLSRNDLTSPADVITLLRAMVHNRDFTNSLAVAGVSGTMHVGLARTAAQGRCRGKTGTLSDVANLVGYCTAADGHTLAFAFLLNAVDPTAGHAAEDRMAVALSRYSG